MKNHNAMLEYCKYILKCVSFDKKLFKKEYRKSLRWLAPHECVRLKVWLREQQNRLNPTSL